MSVKMSSEGDSSVKLDSEKSGDTEKSTTTNNDEKKNANADESSTTATSTASPTTNVKTNKSNATENSNEKKNDDSKQSATVAAAVVKETKDDVDKAVQDNDKGKPDKEEKKDVKVEESSTTTPNKTSKEEKKEKTSNEKVKKEEKKKVENDDDDDEEEEEDDDDEDDDEKKAKPLLDQPLEKTGKRDRKTTQRFDEEYPSEQKESVKVDIPNGSGTALGNIPRIDACISRFKNDDMKLLHRVLFKTPGKSTMIKRNIKKFNGFDFKKDSEEYTKKHTLIHNCELKQLKSICEMLDLVKTGTKEDIGDRIFEFLMEPKDSGKSVGGGRPKRTAAVRANNRGYSSHDNYSSDEHTGGRSSRDKGRRANLKDDSSSHSDEDFEPSDADEEKPRVKRKRTERKKVAQSEDEDDDVSEIESPSSDDSDFQEESKGKRKKPIKTNNKAKGKGTGKRGRPPGGAKKAPTKPGKKRKESSEDEEESDNKEEEGSSSEDEPLVKKAKTAQPPTDEEIKSYVKEILEGANLEQITMKTVCQQVYAHYPDFDLAHKKDFIKTTVKSLIST